MGVPDNLQVTKSVSERYNVKSLPLSISLIYFFMIEARSKAEWVVDYIIQNSILSRMTRMHIDTYIRWKKICTEEMIWDQV